MGKNINNITLKSNFIIKYLFLNGKVSNSFVYEKYLNYSVNKQKSSCYFV